MHKLSKALLLVLISGGVFAQDQIMTTAEIVAFKEKVVVVSKATNSMKSDFVQYKHLDFLENDIKTSGKMSFKKPNLVKWEYTNPYKYSVIFTKEKLLINDGGTKSDVNIGSNKMFKKLNQLIVNSVQGNMFNDADFKVKYAKFPNYYKVVFIPKDKKIAKYIASFVLHFSKKEAAVLEVKMIEPSQDYTRIVFKNRVINSNISDAVFTN